MSNNGIKKFSETCTAYFFLTNSPKIIKVKLLVENICSFNFLNELCTKQGGSSSGVNLQIELSYTAKNFSISCKLRNHVILENHLNKGFSLSGKNSGIFLSHYKNLYHYFFLEEAMHFNKKRKFYKSSCISLEINL